MGGLRFIFEKNHTILFENLIIYNVHIGILFLICSNSTKTNYAYLQLQIEYLFLVLLFCGISEIPKTAEHLPFHLPYKDIDR